MFNVRCLPLRCQPRAAAPAAVPPEQAWAFGLPLAPRPPPRFPLWCRRLAGILRQRLEAASDYESLTASSDASGLPRSVLRSASGERRPTVAATSVLCRGISNMDAAKPLGIIAAVTGDASGPVLITLLPAEGEARFPDERLAFTRTSLCRKLMSHFVTRMGRLAAAALIAACPACD